MEEIHSKKPEYYESFKPAVRAALMAESIIKQIGEKTERPLAPEQPSHAAQWLPYPNDVIYKIEKYDYGTEGKKYLFYVLAADNTLIARFAIHKNDEENSRITQLNYNDNECRLDAREQAEVHSLVLRALTNSVPDESKEILARLFNQEFNATIGRFILSEYAVELRGGVPVMDEDLVRTAVRNHQEYVRLCIPAYLVDTSASETMTEDDEHRQITDLAILAARAAIQMKNQWQNTIDTTKTPDKRFRQTS